jgi:hypothetical protein
MDNKPEYTLEEAVDFALSNEAETIFEQTGKPCDDGTHTVLVWQNRQSYADQYGYSVAQFEAEFLSRYSGSREFWNKEAI